MRPEIQPFGDHGILLRWKQRIHPDIHQQLLLWKSAITAQFRKEVSETVGTYAELAVYVRPQYHVDQLIERLETMNLDSFQTKEIPASMLSIPVCYEPPYALDLDGVAAHTNLTPQEIIKMHSQSSYQVYFLGFLPGFPYLGGLNKALHTPRLASPRPRIPKGSVAIGGEQTGVYTSESPGGWHIIGRTPITFFDPKREPPSLLRPGDRIQFTPICKNEFVNIQRAWEAGTWTLHKKTITP